MAEVTFKNLTKKFGDVTAVDNLTLTIADKEFLVLVGPSGCGKTTALRCLAGLESVTAGDIFVDGERINDIKPKDRDIAMVFQSYALYPHMSVYKNMAFGLRFRESDKNEIDRKVKEAARILDIEKLLERKPRELSGGQRQRVAVGRAIVRNPKVFLFDEPLSNLDAKLRVQTRKEISLLHERLESTFIYVTHDQVEAMSMGTRIAVMDEGVLQQVDTPQNLYDQPANKFVAGFIGSPAMNFFSGSLIDKFGTLTFESDGLSLPIPQSKAAAIGKYLNRRALLGIRPEDIHDPTLPVINIRPAEVQCKVDLIELMGDEIYLYLSCGKKEFEARVDPRSQIRRGNKTTVLFDMDRIHFFDLESDMENPPAIPDQ